MSETEITDQLLTRFNRTIIEELDKTYELVYVAYDDRLSDQQVEWLLSGDMEAFWDSTSEWEFCQQDESASEEAKQLARAIADRWERAGEIDDSGELYDRWEADDALFTEVTEIIRDRDSGDWVGQLARQTPGVLFRVRAAEDDFDADYSYKTEDGEDWPTPAGLLAHVGLPDTEVNRTAAQSIIDNACTYGTCFWLFYAELSDLLNVAEGSMIEVVNPSLLISNVYAGNGHEEAMLGTVRFPASELRTDKGQVGYGWDEIAGVVKSYYRAEARVLAPEPEAATA